MSKSLSLDEIINSKDYTIEEVSCPEWGGSVYVRTIHSDRRDQFELSQVDGGGVGFRARLVCMCLCNAEGEFLNPSDGQIVAMGRKSGAVMTRVFNVCATLNGMRESDAEEAEKN